MGKKLFATIIVVVIILLAFLFICPSVFKDIEVLPQEAKDALTSETISQVPIEWQ